MRAELTKIAVNVTICEREITQSAIQRVREELGASEGMRQRCQGPPDLTCWQRPAQASVVADVSGVPELFLTFMSPPRACVRIQTHRLRLVNTCRGGRRGPRDALPAAI
jgi:hypothetical protein